MNKYEMTFLMSICEKCEFRKDAEADIQIDGLLEFPRATKVYKDEYMKKDYFFCDRILEYIDEKSGKVIRINYGDGVEDQVTECKYYLEHLLNGTE